MNWDWLQNIWQYSEKSPLSFIHLFFWGFFLVVMLFYMLLYSKTRWRNAYLLLVSLFFYFKTSGVFLLLMMFTILSDYTIGRMISRSEKVSTRRWWLSASVTINLLLLCYFKYAFFFQQSYNDITGSNSTFFNHFAHFSNTFFGTSFSVTKMLIPVGVSFFIFQSLSYTIDVYRRNVEPVKNVFDYGFFVCFFPHLVAGPIVKAHDFMHQLYSPYQLTRAEFGTAVFWIVNGFGKKIVADYIALNYIDRIFANPNYFTGAEIIIAIFSYSLQIYMDFSGYTDIAIGIALILGFRLKKNFNSPYKAQNTSDFWKRWHISLSSWLQEYLYIPLGGNRQGTVGSWIAITIILTFLVLISGSLILLAVLAGILILIPLWGRVFPGFQKQVNTNVNLLVTMLLGGLWHGSSSLFMIWGGLNGIGLIVHKYWKKWSPFGKSSNMVVSFFWMLVTLTFISFTRIFFRSDSMQTVHAIFNRIAEQPGWSLITRVLMEYHKVLLIVLLGYIIHWIPESVKEKYRSVFTRLPMPVMAATTAVVVLICYQLMSDEIQPFIYFQF